MTPQMIEEANNSIQAELDRLTCSAYLLTLDPALALSVVMTAVEVAQKEISPPSNLLRRTVELSLQELRRKSTGRSDRESPAFEVLLYGDATTIESKHALLFKENTSANPILLLDYSARVTFVLHHVLGYKINEAAAMVEMSEKEYRAHLRRAYLQLASLHFVSAASASSVVGEVLA
jgi:hypothetical protein